jgi:hypothetical protein
MNATPPCAAASHPERPAIRQLTIIYDNPQLVVHHREAAAFTWQNNWCSRYLTGTGPKVVTVITAHGDTHIIRQCPQIFNALLFSHSAVSPHCRSSIALIDSPRVVHVRRGELTRASSVGMVQISPGTFWRSWILCIGCTGTSDERFFVRCTFLHITIAYDNIAGSTYIVSLTYLLCQRAD